MTTNLARRAFIKGAPVAIATMTAPAAVGISISSRAAAAANTTKASPAMLDAQTRLQRAVDELARAESDLEWLVDEWRHRWPLAPEEILEFTNGDKYYGKEEAERDIAGRFLFRDTSGLTKRLNSKQRQETPRACFTLISEARAQRFLDSWIARQPTGRTPKALAKNIAYRNEAIERFKRQRDLARAYEREAKRVREAARVDEFHERIGAAHAQVKSVCHEISMLPARNIGDLAVKAKALRANGGLDFIQLWGAKGVLGEVARFISSTAEFDRDLSGASA